MIIGHRGGYFGPENSMKCFRKAFEANLEGIEFDVSKAVFLVSNIMTQFLILGLAKL